MDNGKFDATLPLTNKWLQDTFSNLIASQDAASSSVDMTLLMQGGDAAYKQLVYVGSVELLFQHSQDKLPEVFCFDGYRFDIMDNMFRSYILHGCVVTTLYAKMKEAVRESINRSASLFM